MASSARRVFFMVDPFVASDGTGCTNRTWRSGDDAATSSWRDWQANPEAAASAPALDADLTVLRLDQMLDDGEADPRPARLARTLGGRDLSLAVEQRRGVGDSLHQLPRERRRLRRRLRRSRLRRLSPEECHSVL